MNIVAMIPARSGSNGVINKNIRVLGGAPLISYSILAALECNVINDVYLNSDSTDYLTIGAEYGAKAFKRSSELAEDDSPMLPVIQDFVLNMRNQGKLYDAIIVLYPVYPWRDSVDLANMIDAFCNIGGSRPLIGVKKPKTHPYLCYRLDSEFTPLRAIDYDENIFYRRQTYPEYYEIIHWACILPTDSLERLNNQLMSDDTFGYIINSNKASVNIDEEEDFKYASSIMKEIL